MIVNLHPSYRFTHFPARFILIQFDRFPRQDAAVDDVDLGVALAATPGAGAAAARFVPLRVSYDAGVADAATAPLSFADLNLLLNRTDWWRKRKNGGGGGGGGGGGSSSGGGGNSDDGHGPGDASDQLAYSNDAGFAGIAGFAATADCSVCNVSLSESYPSAGGADCAYECGLYGSGSDSHDDDEEEEPSCFTTTFDIGAIDSPAAQAFRENMIAADEAILQYGKKDVR